jgi:DNA adenine methylase
MKIRPPLKYYGGKQRMSKEIIKLIPEHTTYVEPFFGGGAVFFSKKPSKVECINDINGEIINFYRVIKHDFDKLKYLIEESLWSRQLFNEAKIIFKNPENIDSVKRAWAVWLLANESFGARMKEFGSDIKSNISIKGLNNKIETFTKEYEKRLSMTQIDNEDAIKNIKRFDTENTFFYIDPPYYNSDCRPYKGYTIDDFKILLETLLNIKGKFLLSSYPSEVLNEYIEKGKWDSKEIIKTLCVNVSSRTKNKDPDTKTEVLTANYSLERKQDEGIPIPFSWVKTC